MTSRSSAMHFALCVFIGLATASADINECLDEDAASFLQTGALAAVHADTTQFHNGTEDPLDALFSWSDMWEMSTMPTESSWWSKKKIGGWTLKVAVKTRTVYSGNSVLDGVQVWQHEGGVCSLTWGTTDSLLDDCLHKHSDNHREDDHFTECGMYGLSVCLVHEMHHLLLHEDWVGKVVPYVQDHCTKGLVTEGYSMGGWLAEVYAICANHLNAMGKSSISLGVHIANRTVAPLGGTDEDVNVHAGGEALIPGPVDAIYSLAAIPLSVHKNQLVNALDPDGWFRGKRIFVHDPVGVDPFVIAVNAHDFSGVPDGEEVEPCYHPYMQSYKLTMKWPFFWPRARVERAPKEDVMMTPFVDTKEYNFIMSPLVLPFRMATHLKYGPISCIMDRWFVNYATVAWCLLTHNRYRFTR